jgi:hypothetical protein
MTQFTSIVANNVIELTKRSPLDLVKYLRFIETPVVSPYERDIIKREVRRLNNLKAKN